MKDDSDLVAKKEFREGLDEFAQMVNSSFKKMATKDDLKEVLKNYPTKDDLKKELAKYATKADLQEALKQYATKEDIRAINNELFDRLDSHTFKQLHNHEVRIQKLEVRR